MSVITFIIILAILILVHEFGHFIVAVKSGIKVTEFGIGFPPKLVKLFKWKETVFTLNWIPFGGFVKIFGENPDDESISGPDSQRSFVNKPKWIQALVLVAGVAFNLIFAWILISAGYMSGLPTPVSYVGPGEVRDAQVIVTGVTADSPAMYSLIKVGDAIKGVSVDEANTLSVITPESVSAFIAANDSSEITLDLMRGKDSVQAKVTPASGIVPDKKAVGIAMDEIGILSLPIHLAVYEGFKTTAYLTYQTAVGLVQFVSSAFVGNASLQQVTGPVGIVGMVGDVSQLGFIFILSFTAFISINLAVINLVPFPALDGGRLLFVLIEKITGKPIRPKVANMVNGIGFVLLLLLMLVVTVNDVVKLF
jgi:regulator of sigma E protease